ncbi:MAG TPA: serine/threonine-protein kinase [Myxococcaceae bacterium]|nr:serine/threonine-protein kinase [Myxococcaceae bacterium]
MDGIRGWGTFGTVYRAVAEGDPQANPVALKLAVYPGDVRFAREVELLSRIRHPSVPQLLEAGVWRSPLGVKHPFVVMEWVEGEPLYTWASRRTPSSRQVLALLAQVAGALQAIHEVSGLHRDVKGDNMLVRLADGRLFLTDLGAGYFARAAKLTPWHTVPGTPEYRSPQLWQAAQRSSPEPGVSLPAQPEDDVFALGVTAYRLVTDTYPPFAHPAMRQWHSWLPGESGAVPPKQLNPRVDAQLNALILRMLSPRHEERGEAGALEQAMERGVAHAVPATNTLLFEWETLPPSKWAEVERAEAEYLGHRPRRRDRQWVLIFDQMDATARARAEQREAEARAPAARATQPVRSRRWMSWLAALLTLGLWPEESGSLRTRPGLALSESTSEEDVVSLGESALRSPDEPAKSPRASAVAQQVLKNPLPGQLKPDAKGRCPNKQIAIKGGCWLKVEAVPEECPTTGYTHQGGCYFPFFASKAEPAAAPQE